AGEPLRVITGGLDPVPGSTILEKRRFARERLDGLRRGLVFEPRGHADMYGAIPTEPVTPDGDAGVLFMHNEGWSTMCGHGVIALVTVALEIGLLSGRDVVRLDTPAGRVTARPRRERSRVRSVAFENVPSFVVSLDDRVEVPGLGTVRYDLAFGGAFYAFVDAASVGLAMTPARFRDLIAAGSAIKRAVASPQVKRSSSRASSAHALPAASPARSSGKATRRSCRRSKGAHGLPGEARSSSRRTIPSRRVSSCADALAELQREHRNATVQAFRWERHLVPFAAGAHRVEKRVVVVGR